MKFWYFDVMRFWLIFIFYGFLQMLCFRNRKGFEVYFDDFGFNGSWRKIIGNWQN